MPYVLPVLIKVPRDNAILTLIFFVTIDVVVAGECEARFDRRVSGLAGGHGGDQQPPLLRDAV